MQVFITTPIVGKWNPCGSPQETLGGGHDLSFRMEIMYICMHESGSYNITNNMLIYVVCFVGDT